MEIKISKVKGLLRREEKNLTATIEMLKSMQNENYRKQIEKLENYLKEISQKIKNLGNH